MPAKSTTRRPHRGRDAEFGTRAQSAGTQSLERAFALLKLIAMQGRRGARISQLCELSGLQRPTVHRMVGALCTAGFVESSDKTYGLGSLLFELGLAAPSPVKNLEIVKGPLERLALETADSAYLVMRRGDEAVCLAIATGAYPVRAITFEVGARRPLGMGAAGLALLSALPPDEASAIVDRNTRTLRPSGVTLEILKDRMDRTRRRGFALSEGTITQGVTGMAITVAARAGPPFLALSVAAISARMPKTRQSQILASLRKAAQATETLVSFSNAANN